MEFIRKNVYPLALTALYAVLIGWVFWGAWSMDRAFVQPDAAITYAADDLARWWTTLWADGNVVPTDLMRAVGGMYFWQELQYALAAFLAALGLAYYLKGRGLPPLARYGAGAAYGLMGYNFTLFSAGHLGWFVWMMYGPFVFGLVDRCVRKGGFRRWATLGTVLAWAASRQPDLWLLFTVLSFAYGIYRVIAAVREGRSFVKLLGGTGVAVAAMLLVGAPQLYTAVFVHTASRDRQIADTSGRAGEDLSKKETDPAEAAKKAQERWLFCTSWSLPPEDILEFAIADVHGGSTDPRVSPKNPYRGRLGQHGVVPAGAQGRHPVTGQTLSGGDEYWMPYRQHSLYMGVFTVLLALVGLFSAAKRRENRGEIVFWGVAGVVLLLCALGGFTPFYRLVYALPVGDYIRCPVKFVHLVEWCTAALAGFGIAFLLARGGARTWVPWVLGALAAVNAVDLARVDRRYCAVDPNDTLRIAVAKASGGDGEAVSVQAAQGRETLGYYRWSPVKETIVTAPKEQAQFAVVRGKPWKAPEPKPRWHAVVLISLLTQTAFFGMILGCSFHKRFKRKEKSENADA